MIIAKNNNKAFTLIEILVSLTILSIIMVSVMFIFINSTSLSAKTEINRVMQENIKNVVQTISEDVRINWIKWVSKNSLDSCDFVYGWSYNYKDWTKLCTNINNVYFLAKEIWDTAVRIDDISLCEGLGDNCFIVKNWDRLTNSSVSVKDLQFYITNDYVPKVTIAIVLQPSARKWVKPSLIKENKIILQTTISEKTF